MTKQGKIDTYKHNEKKIELWSVPQGFKVKVFRNGLRDNTFTYKTEELARNKFNMYKVRAPEFRINPQKIKEYIADGKCESPAYWGGNVKPKHIKLKQIAVSNSSEYISIDFIVDTDHRRAEFSEGFKKSELVEVIQ